MCAERATTDYPPSDPASCMAENGCQGQFHDEPAGCATCGHPGPVWCDHDCITGKTIIVPPELQRMFFDES